MGLFGLLTGKNTRLLELQRLVLKDSPNKLVLSEKQLMEVARKDASRRLEICNDCLRIIDTTTNPDAFFSRFDLLITHLSVLQGLEKHISFTGSPSKSLARIHSAKQEIIHGFLVRYHKSIVAQANAAKTTRGKQGKYKKFIESLQPYYTQMNTDNIRYIESQCKAYSTDQKIEVS